MNFDLGTAIIAILLSPLIFRLARKAASFVGKWAAKLLDATLWLISHYLETSISATVNMKRYCKIELERPENKYLLVPGREVVSLETDSIYVPLTLETGRGTQAADPMNVIRAHNRVRIVGDPGSGKSSLAKNLLRTGCREAMEKKSGHRLPVIIEMRTLRGRLKENKGSSGQSWLLEVIREKVCKVHGHSMGEFVDSYSKSNGLLILLDGLDEVGSADYASACSGILELSGALSNLGQRNCIVLTMRTQFHQQIRGDFDTLFPPTYHIKPFDVDDVYRFLTLWPDFHGDRDKETLRIFNNLHDRPTLADMCTNPLVLAMYVNNDQLEGKTLVPETRTAFYSQVVEELLIARRGRQLAIKKRGVLREQRESLLGRLALGNLLDPASPANLIPWAEAVTVTKQICRCDTDDQAVSRLKEVCTETGLMTIEREGESLRFIHLTFEEFLAALEARNKSTSGWEEVINAYERFQMVADGQVRTRLTEVLPFLLGLLPRADRLAALTKVAEVATPDVMGRCFLETKAYDHPTWRNYLLSETAAIRTSKKSEWDEDWTRKLHLFSVVLQDEEEWKSAYGASPSGNLGTLLREMVERETQGLIEVIGRSSALDPTIIFRIADELEIDLLESHPELVRSNLGSSPFRATVAQRVESTPRLVGVWAEIVAGACLGNAYIASLLAYEEPGDALCARVEPLKRRSCWYRKGREGGGFDAAENHPFRPSLFTYSLTYILNANGFAHGGDSVKWNRRFMRIKPPGALISSAVIRACSSVPLIVWISLIAFLWVRDGKSSLGAFAWSLATFLAVTAAIAMYLTIGLFVLPKYRAILYYHLVNPSANKPLWLRAHSSIRNYLPGIFVACMVYHDIRAVIVGPSDSRGSGRWNGPPRFA